MELIAKLNHVDKDIVELFSENGKWFCAIMHIDCFDDLPTELFYDPIQNGDKVSLTVTVK